MTSEFEGIITLTNGTLRPAYMDRPAPLQASKAFIREVSEALNMDDADDDAAVAAADWILNKMERYGARTARPILADGDGPMCSWCGAEWPSCGHQHLSEVPSVIARQAGRPGR